MNYQQKYLKYKAKYLNLKKIKGGDKSFEIIELKKGTILYHGTYNNIPDMPFTPVFFSTDILQSLGHIILKFQKINYLYNEYKSNITKNKTDKNIEEINKNIKGINYRLNTISSCYPVIYNYSFNRSIKLLKMNDVHTYDNTFKKLFNVKILMKYIYENEKAYEIINDHVTRMKNIGTDYGNFEESIEKYNEKSEAEKKEIIKKILEIYNNKCREGCFGGWTNTPGYYIINNIDFNAYFKEIKLINKDDVIDGIYVERDQDEIIIFNINDLSNKDINYILPFSYEKNNKRKNNTDHIDYTGHIYYINKYIEYAKIFKTDYLKFPNSISKNSEKFINLITKLCYIDHTNSDDKKWIFAWFITACEKYNPYLDINDNSNGCAKSLECKTRLPVDSNESLFKSIINNYLKDDQQYYACKDNFKSAKLSIANLENIDNLKKYISFIKKCSLKELEKELEITNIFKDCLSLSSDSAIRKI
jgi:hypothetical protein